MAMCSTIPALLFATAALSGAVCFRSSRSASAPSAPSGKTKRVSYEDLTLEDVVKMSAAEYAKIPREHRNRLLAS